MGDTDTKKQLIRVHALSATMYGCGLLGIMLQAVSLGIDKWFKFSDTTNTTDSLHQHGLNDARNEAHRDKLGKAGETTIFWLLLVSILVQFFSLLGTAIFSNSMKTGGVNRIWFLFVNTMLVWAAFVLALIPNTIVGHALDNKYLWGSAHKMSMAGVVFTFFTLVQSTWIAYIILYCIDEKTMKVPKPVTVGADAEGVVVSEVEYDEARKKAYLWLQLVAIAGNVAVEVIMILQGVAIWSHTWVKDGEAKCIGVDMIKGLCIVAFVLIIVTSLLATVYVWNLMNHGLNYRRLVGIIVGTLSLALIFQIAAVAYLEENVPCAPSAFSGKNKYSLHVAAIIVDVIAMIGWVPLLFLWGKKLQ